MAKTYKQFKEQTGRPLKLNIEKIWCDQKNNNWAILPDSSPYRYEVNEKSHFPTKNPKIKSLHSWPNHFWNPIANVSVQVQYGKTSI